MANQGPEDNPQKLIRLIESTQPKPGETINDYIQRVTVSVIMHHLVIDVELIRKTAHQVFRQH